MLIHAIGIIYRQTTRQTMTACATTEEEEGREKLLKAIKVTIIVLRGEKQATETLRHAGKRE